MPKIALIGAGSIAFARRLIVDLLAFEELQDATYALVDIDPERLELSAELMRHIVATRGLPARVEAHTEARAALPGCDAVITMINVGEDEYVHDLRIPQKYGVDQQVGDTIGPGGVFRGLRAAPVLIEICRDIEAECPDAWLLNYTNPMAIVTWAMNVATRVKLVGLCHSVQGTSRQLASYIGKPYEEMTYWVAGINHMAWFLELKWRGGNAYPLLRKALEDPEVRGKDPVRFEVFRHFGYFVTESSAHMSEYVPYFRSRPERMPAFNLRTREESGAGRKRRREDYSESVRRQIAGQESIPDERSHEYASYIIHSLLSNTPRRFNGSVLNHGLIGNLPPGCCVEVPCLVDGTGIRPCVVGNLPPQLAALNRSNIAVQELAVEAILQRDPEKAFQAIALDPLTSAVLSLEEIRKMVDELLAAERDWLPW